MVKDNHLLGKFDLKGIKKAPRGVAQIEVTFEMAANYVNKHLESNITNTQLPELKKCNKYVYIFFKHDLGMPDDALKSKGRSIIDSSKSFRSKKPPSLILNNNVEPANCWITVAKDTFVEISISEKV
ncbi:hypothetical protein A3Q56_03683 [Intoshia linei]|uniref:Uncharacterized protein n=1 Tax=Intoshia linei TaxID=1819745 RepID=A0A177B2L3_9BILA|nr:hypothetical protein A3Q56_03683 [Intoshia linei]